MGKFACICIFALIAALVYEASVRYFFNSPTVWANETSQYLFGIFFLMGGGYTLQHKGHVRVDIVLLALSKRTRRIMGIICYTLSFLYLCVRLPISAEKAWESIYYMEVLDSIWKPYTFPVLIFVPIGVFLMQLQMLSMVIKTVHKLKFDDDGDGI
jgi:TRAP-type mannitol/chloroaromatic compound transport system permease small subunit